MSVSSINFIYKKLPIDIIYNNIFPFLEPHIRVELKCNVPVKLNMNNYNIRLQKHEFKYYTNTYHGSCWSCFDTYILDNMGFETCVGVAKWIYDDETIHYKFYFHNYTYWKDSWFTWCSQCGSSDMGGWPCSNNCTDVCVCGCYYCDKTITNEEKTDYFGNKNEFIFNEEQISIDKKLLYLKLDLCTKNPSYNINNLKKEELENKIDNCKSLYDTTELWGIIGDYNLNLKHLKHLKHLRLLNR